MKPNDDPEVPSIPAPKKRGIARNFTLLLLLLIVVGLSGVIVYLLSDINQRQYRLNSHNGMLIVEQGRFLPYGFKPYVPSDPTLAPIYAPLELPKEVKVEPSEVLKDRTDLDRAIFGLLSGWSRQRINSPDSQEFQLVATYISRCETLPGLAEEQRRELQILRADVAYKTGLVTLKNIATQLNTALEKFELALSLGTTHADEAQSWIGEIQHRIKTYQSSDTPRPVDDPPPLAIPNPELSPSPSEPSDTPAKEPSTPAPKAEPDSSSEQKWKL